MSSTQTNHEFPRGIEVVTGTIIRNKEGKILLITSPKWQGKWVIAGGHVDPGETILDCAVREVKEELGIDVTPVTIMKWRELIAPKDFHRPAHLISFVCILEAEKEEVLADPREVSEYRWVTPQEALELPLTSNLYQTIEEYIDFTR